MMRFFLHILILGSVFGCKRTSDSAVRSEVPATSIKVPQAVTTDARTYVANMREQITNFEKGLAKNGDALFCQTLGYLYLTAAQYVSNDPHPWLKKAKDVANCPQPRPNLNLVLLSTIVRLKAHDAIPKEEFDKILAPLMERKNDVRNLRLEYLLANDQYAKARDLLATQQGHDLRAENHYLMGRLEAKRKEYAAAHNSYVSAIEKNIDPNPFFVAAVYHHMAENLRAWGHGKQASLAEQYRNKAVPRGTKRI